MNTCERVKRQLSSTNSFHEIDTDDGEEEVNGSDKRRQPRRRREGRYARQLNHGGCREGSLKGNVDNGVTCRNLM